MRIKVKRPPPEVQKTKWVNPFSDAYSSHIIMRLLHHVLDHDVQIDSPSKVKRRYPNMTSRGKRRSVILVGHSQGAHVALNAMSLFPQSFSGLILVNPGLFSEASCIPGFAPNLFRQVGHSFFKLLPSLIPSRLAYYDYNNSVEEELRLAYQRVFHDKNWSKALRLWGEYHFTEGHTKAICERILLQIDIPGRQTVSSSSRDVPDSWK